MSVRLKNRSLLSLVHHTSEEVDHLVRLAVELKEAKRLGQERQCLQGKNIALFGSYGWGDGEWMRSWEERCSQDGANLAADSVICNEAPDDEALSECRALGAALA